MWRIRRVAAIVAIGSGILGLRIAGLSAFAGVAIPLLGLVLTAVFGVAVLLLIGLWLLEPLSRDWD